jgi:hypothetical protein
MPIERSRITLLAGGAALAITLATRRWARAAAGPAPAVTVYKNPT